MADLSSSDEFEAKNNGIKETENHSPELKSRQTRKKLSSEDEDFEIGKKSENQSDASQVLEIKKSKKVSKPKKTGKPIVNEHVKNGAKILRTNVPISSSLTKINPKIRLGLSKTIKNPLHKKLF